jgi:hypothetical protein
MGRSGPAHPGPYKIIGLLGRPDSPAHFYSSSNKFHINPKVNIFYKKLIEGTNVTK